MDVENVYLQNIPAESKYNVLDKAYSSLGYKHTAGAKLKISMALRGRTISEASKENLSKLFTGAGNLFYGKTHTEEFKQRLSESRMGELNPMYNKPKSPEFIYYSLRPRSGGDNPRAKSIVVVDTHNNNKALDFVTITAAAEHLKVSRSSASSYLNRNKGKLLHNRYKLYFKADYDQLIA